MEIRPEDFRIKRSYPSEMILATIYGLEKQKDVVPFDWFKGTERQERNKYSKTEEYKTKSVQYDEFVLNSKIIQDFEAEYGTSKKYNAQNPSFLFFNGTAYNNYIEETYKLDMQVYGDHAMNFYYESRNGHMMQNISKVISQNPGKRIIVLTGAEHKHYLDNKLTNYAGTDLRQVSEIMPLKSKEELQIPEKTTFFLNSERFNKYELYYKNTETYCNETIITLLHGFGADKLPLDYPQNKMKILQDLIAKWDAIGKASTMLLLHKGDLALREKKFKEAATLLEECERNIDSIKNYPRLPDFQKGMLLSMGLYRDLGLTYQHLGEIKRTQTAFQKGMELAKQLDLPANGTWMFFPKDFIAPDETSQN